MRYLITLIIVATLVSCTSKIYITRHGEKGTTPTLQDPDLKDSGLQRAQDLKALLLDKNIKDVYSTNFRRTRQTAQPTAEALVLPITLFNVDTSGRFIRQVAKKLKNALIVSHSNRILPMLDSINVPHSISAIPENDYDNLFILTVRRALFSKRLKYSLKETTYGASSPVVGNTP